MIKRLTERDEYGNANIIGVDSAELQLNLEFDELNRVTNALNRLAGYEDSGLSPEEITVLKTSEKICEDCWNYALVQKDGRLVALPCKVGDVVWKIKAVYSYFSKPMEDRVDRIIISNNEILVCCTGGAKFSIDSIGKTVFLTREEAEKALGGGEE